MGEMSELETWALETARDIDAKLCKQAEKYANRPKVGDERDFVKIQEARIDLIKAIMRD
jgi:hypothetical protein